MEKASSGAMLTVNTSAAIVYNVLPSTGWRYAGRSARVRLACFIGRRPLSRRVPGGISLGRLPTATSREAGGVRRAAPASGTAARWARWQRIARGAGCGTRPGTRAGTYRGDPARLWPSGASSNAASRSARSRGPASRRTPCTSGASRLRLWPSRKRSSDQRAATVGTRRHDLSIVQVADEVVAIAGCAATARGLGRIEYRLRCGHLARHLPSVHRRGGPKRLSVTSHRAPPSESGQAGRWGHRGCQSSGESAARNSRTPGSGP